MQARPGWETSRGARQCSSSAIEPRYLAFISELRRVVIELGLDCTIQSRCRLNCSRLCPNSLAASQHTLYFANCVFLAREGAMAIFENAMVKKSTARQRFAAAQLVLTDATLGRLSQ